MTGRGGAPRLKQILFVVEGERLEHDLILSAMKAIGVDTERFAIVAFHTNAHAFIDAIIVGNRWKPDDFAEVETREVVAGLLENGYGSLRVMWGADKACESEKGPTWLRSTSFTDTFLMFDFDPQDDRYDSQKLMAFQRSFCDSTGDSGKLLLSYPMLESFREACALGIDEYFETRAYMPFSAYKHAVHTRLHEEGLGEYCDFGSYDRIKYAKGAAHTVAKAYALLVGGDLRDCHRVIRETDLAACCDAVDLPGLLACQQQTYAQEGTLSSVTTALFFLSAWSRKLNQVWWRCRGMGIA